MEKIRAAVENLSVAWVLKSAIDPGVADLIGPATHNVTVTGSGAVAVGNMTITGTHVAGRDLTIG